jgi:NADPH:quinone reductase-like Zn-dependent oxidoreductase
MMILYSSEWTIYTITLCQHHTAHISNTAKEVVIKNRAVAINPTDWVMQALGGIPLPYPMYPYIEGCDTAG